MIPSGVPFIQRESSGDADAIEMIQAGTGTSGQFDHEFIVVISLAFGRCQRWNRCPPRGPGGRRGSEAQGP